MAIQSIVKSTEALVLREYKATPQLETVTLNGLHPDEALVEIEASGICHTDISTMGGRRQVSLPRIFGHEGAGTIVQLGENLRKEYQVGDKVLCSFNSCGQCKYCKADHPAYCVECLALSFPASGTREDDSPFYLSASGEAIRASFFGQSSFAHHAIVQKRCLVKVDPEPDLALFAPLGCGFGTGAGAAINVAEVTEGSSVAIWGVGGVGMTTLMAAKMRGAKIMIAIDIVESRLQLAKELGATHTLAGDMPNLVERVKEITLDTDGLNYAFDTTAVTKVCEAIFDCMGRRSKMVMIAPGYGNPMTLNIGRFPVTGMSVMGCLQGDSNPKEV